jgi:hypothetical protein
MPRPQEFQIQKHTEKFIAELTTGQHRGLRQNATMKDGQTRVTSRKGGSGRENNIAVSSAEKVQKREGCETDRSTRKRREGRIRRHNL